MAKHVWKTHREKPKKFEDALVNIFNIGNSYFNGYINRKETARVIANEINSVINNWHC